MNCECGKKIRTIPYGHTFIENGITYIVLRMCKNCGFIKTTTIMPVTMLHQH